jgi:mannose/fructose/N-acetylgalactosamine-specific phosphotransferase system component IID
MAMAMQEEDDEESTPLHATTHASTKVGYMGPAEF